MIRCQDFAHWLAALGVDFYTGVPDSLLELEHRGQCFRISQVPM